MEKFARLDDELLKANRPDLAADLSNLIEATLVSDETYKTQIILGYLSRLRSGSTNDLLEMLEVDLDDAIIGLGNYPNQLHDQEFKVLAAAKAYRTRFPRTTGHSETDADVARVLRLPPTN